MCTLAGGRLTLRFPMRNHPTHPVDSSGHASQPDSAHSTTAETLAHLQRLIPQGMHLPTNMRVDTVDAMRLALITLWSADGAY